MCGRFVLTATPEELEALFGYLDGEPFPPRYNIAPTQPIAIVRMMGGARRFALVRWGLVPSWVKDPKQFSLLINARAEGILDKASFRAAMRYRRCLVPASGFYEWRKMPGSNSGKTRQPFWLRPRDGEADRLCRPVGDMGRPRDRRRDRFGRHRHHQRQRRRGTDPRPHAGGDRARRISSSG